MPNEKHCSKSNAQYKTRIYRKNSFVILWACLIDFHERMLCKSPCRLINKINVKSQMLQGGKLQHHK